MARHEVIQGPVEHDGARYEEGAQIQLSPDAAEALVGLGILKLLQEEAKPKGKA